MVSAEHQLAFLGNLQRLFSEGVFVATYKFALLSALADLSVELGDDSGNELEVPTQAIAEKFIQYYWRQCRPFAAAGNSNTVILRQNTGKEAGVLQVIRTAQGQDFSTLAALRSDAKEWNRVVRRVDRIVQKMPLMKLQTFGRSQFEFLYENKVIDSAIRLKEGVAFCFRAFHTFITDMIRGAWIRHVRRNNCLVLGQPTDLDEFLFGSERASLAVYVNILREIQESCCFYCGKEIKATASDVDHFVPWSLYPVDLGHNFVLADTACNSAKSDLLAGVDHLEKWTSRNRDTGEYLIGRFNEASIVHDIRSSEMITRWAYLRVASVGGQTFHAPDIYKPLSESWQHILDQLGGS